MSSGRRERSLESKVEEDDDGENGFRQLVHQADHEADPPCLAENDLHLEHYECGRGILTGLMGHCAAVARLNR